MMKSLLRPDPAELAAEWLKLVAAEREQAERLREWQETDYYRPMVQHFVVDPRRTDDPLLDALLTYTRSDATWLDVGAGGGRYALPLALHSRHVIAVEPSQAMRAALAEGAQAAGIDNIEIKAERWPEEAGDYQVDFSLMAHVGYDLLDIGGFLDALERSTRERCFAILIERAPSSTFEDLWLQIHGEPRIILPGMREFLQLLLARGAFPDVRIIPRHFRTMTDDDVRENARRRLWLSAGSPKDRRLQALLDGALPAGPDAFQQPSQVALISWPISS